MKPKTFALLGLFSLLVISGCSSNTHESQVILEGEQWKQLSKSLEYENVGGMNFFDTSEGRLNICDAHDPDTSIR